MWDRLGSDLRGQLIRRHHLARICTELAASFTVAAAVWLLGRTRRYRWK
jgi:hypothetical protein